MSGSLVFLEHKDEIKAIEQFILEDTVVVAMLPSVGVELKKKGIPFENTISLFTASGHRQTLLFSKLIVEGVRPFLVKINAAGVQQSFEKTWVVYFRVHLHYWITMLHIINKAVEMHNPDHLIIVRKNNNNNNTNLGAIVEKYGLSHEINIQYVNKSVSNKYSKNIPETLKHGLIKLIFEFQLWIFSFIRLSRCNLLVTSDIYNMSLLMGKISQHVADSFLVYLSMQKKSLKTRLIEMLKGDTFSFISLPIYVPSHEDTIFQEKYDDCMSHIRSWFHDFNNTTTIYGVNLNSSLLRYIENELKKKMIDLYGQIMSLRRVLDIVNPKSAFAQHSLGINYALGEFCLKEEIPALLISHGTHVLIKDPLPSYEWSVHAHTIVNSMYPFVALQTPLDKKFLEKQDGVVSQGINTGPLLFAEPNSHDQTRFDLRHRLFGKHTTQRIILHAGTPMSWQSYRPWVFETIDEYICNINAVIKAVEGVSGSYLAIRFRPHPGINLDDFKMSLRGSNCYGIYSEGSFEEHLLGSDLLISYSSTTIVQSLQKQVPVLQYDPDGKYEHIHGQVLSTDGKNHLSTVYSVLSENDLMPALDWWKEHHSEKMNIRLDWSEHNFDTDNNMEWLTTMGLK